MKVFNGKFPAGVINADPNFMGFTKEGELYVDRRLRTSRVCDAQMLDDEDNVVVFTTASRSQYTVRFEENEFHSYFGLVLKAEILFHPAFIGLRNSELVEKLG